MRIFLSYASEDRPLAARIAARLELEDHDVFFDRHAIQAGSGYDQQIRQEVGRCDLFLFVVSPHSIKEGRYTLTELGFARENWRNLGTRVLPVMARDTPIESIPAVLSALDIQTREGNLEAEVVARVAKIAKKRRQKIVLSGGAVASLAAVAIWYFVGPYSPGGEPIVDNGLKSTDECSDMSLFENCATELARRICREQHEVASILDGDGGLGVEPPVIGSRDKVYFFGAVNSSDERDATQLQTLLKNVRFDVANASLDAAPPHQAENAFLDGPVVLNREYQSADDALLILSSQLNPPRQEEGETRRDGDSSIYFGTDRALSVKFTLPENSFSKPYNLHRAAIGYARSQLVDSYTEKQSLLSSAWFDLRSACDNE